MNNLFDRAYVSSDRTSSFSSGEGDELAHRIVHRSSSTDIKFFNVYEWTFARFKNV